MDSTSGQVLINGSKSRCGLFPTWRSSRRLTVHLLSGKSQDPRVLSGHWETWHSLISDTETLRDLKTSLRQGRNVTALFTPGATKEWELNTQEKGAAPEGRGEEWSTRTYGGDHHLKSSGDGGFCLSVVVVAFYRSQRRSLLQTITHISLSLEPVSLTL